MKFFERFVKTFERFMKFLERFAKTFKRLMKFSEQFTKTFERFMKSTERFIKTFERCMKFLIKIIFQESFQLFMAISLEYLQYSPKMHKQELHFASARRSSSSHIKTGTSSDCFNFLPIIGSLESSKCQRNSSLSVNLQSDRKLEI